MAATTPTGSRTTSESPTSSSNGKVRTISANDPITMRGPPTCTNVANGRGQPISSATSSPISGSRPTRTSCRAWTSRARSSTGVAAHPSKAARAAATARSTSAPDPSGTWPITSSVAGLTSSITSDARA